MERTPELKTSLSSDHPSVIEKKTKRKKFYIILVAIFVMGLIFIILSHLFTTQKQRPVVEEEFHTSGFHPPALTTEKKIPEGIKRDESLIVLPTTPPPPPLTAPVTALAPPVTQPEAPVTETFPDRYKSNLIVFDAHNQMQADVKQQGNIDRFSVGDDDANNKFINSVSQNTNPSETAIKLNRTDALVVEGTLIPGLLETAINSDLPGQIRAITSQDVYSFDGRRVLIPQGTRLIGEYQSQILEGQKRILVMWTRLIRDDGVSVRLKSIGTDSLGRSGLTGDVDNKWLQRFGSAALISMVGVGMDYMASRGASDNPWYMQSNADMARAHLQKDIAKTTNDLANQALGKNLYIPPTITVNQGERIFVYVRQDLDFSNLYPDPVRQALQEIKRERSHH
ncbi:type IV secretion system protein VirB10 [Pseudochrobactrum sp. MP213Fo]|uniref:type IV secretion system protein VirB10 n=1 Tax=Pseudochrobactrum sp. MP213Fo TaxID=3022250 RepID=UPI003B9FA0D3